MSAAAPSRPSGGVLSTPAPTEAARGGLPASPAGPPACPLSPRDWAPRCSRGHTVGRASRPPEAPFPSTAAAPGQELHPRHCERTGPQTGHTTGASSCLPTSPPDHGSLCRAEGKRPEHRGTTPANHSPTLPHTTSLSPCPAPHYRHPAAKAPPQPRWAHLTGPPPGLLPDGQLVQPTVGDQAGACASAGRTRRLSRAGERRG